MEVAERIKSEVPDIMSEIFRHIAGKNLLSRECYELDRPRLEKIVHCIASKLVIAKPYKFDEYDDDCKVGKFRSKRGCRRLKICIELGEGNEIEDIYDGRCHYTFPIDLNDGYWARRREPRKTVPQPTTWAEVIARNCRYGFPSVI